MLQKQRAAFGSVLAALDSSAQTAWANRYNRLVDSLIADAVKADTAKIGSVPETLDGVLQLTALRGGFETTFGDFHGISSVDSAREDYSRGRMRILAMAFPTWRKEVDGLPLEAPAVASKHQMFESLFPGKEDRATPVYTQYEAPLRSKEDQLRAVLASNTRKDTERVENSNGTVGGQERGGTSERRGTVASSSFTARGLASESTLTKMFSGDFLHIDFDRNDVKFNGLFDQYLVAYSRHCGDALPPDKVEMTKRECRWSTVTEIRNGWGTLISSTESCNEWETVHVGWAKPALYSAKKAVDMQRAGDVGRELSQTLSDITSRNLLGGVMQKLAAARAIADDMDSLVQINACKSPGLERFEENLRLFALNQQPIRMDGKSLGSAVTVIPGIPFKDQNYSKLLTDLVEDDAQKWGAMAKYVPGSVGGASVSSRDDVGRPVKVVASYGWESMLGRNKGRITHVHGRLAELLLLFGDPRRLSRRQSQGRRVVCGRRLSAVGSRAVMVPVRCVGLARWTNSYSENSATRAKPQRAHWSPINGSIKDLAGLFPWRIPTAAASNKPRAEANMTTVPPILGLP